MSCVDELKDKKIAVWGVGAYLRANIRYLDAALEVAFFVDHSEKLIGTEPFCDGRVCYVPEKLTDKGIDTILIGVEQDEVIQEIEQESSNMQISCIRLKDILQECIYIWEKPEIEKAEQLDRNYQDDGVLKRVFECNMDGQVCNFRCHYCLAAGKYGKRNTPFLHSVRYMTRALSKRRVGGTAFIWISSYGEPLLKPEIVSFIHLLLEEGHYVALNTNAVLTQKVNELLEMPREYCKRLMVKGSIHYLELMKHNLVEEFWTNLKKIKEAGAGVMPGMVGCDEYMPYVDKIKSECMEYLGVLPQVDMCRDESQPITPKEFPILTKLEYDDYCEFWRSNFGSSCFDTRAAFHKHITEKCYAGKYACHLDLMSGALLRCPRNVYMGNIYEDLENPIVFEQDSHGCPNAYCSCEPVYLGMGCVKENSIPTFVETMAPKDSNGNYIWPEEMVKVLSRKLCDD